MFDQRGSVAKEQLFCPYCRKVIYRKELIDCGVDESEITRITSGFPSKRDESTCLKCSKMIMADDKVVPCDHPFHKLCLLEYLETQPGANGKCLQCGKYIEGAAKEIIKDKRVRQSLCCICCKATVGQYQSLSCGHYFCRECSSKYINSPTYFLYEGREIKVRCSHCNSMSS
jgi:hypothetical protein